MLAHSLERIKEILVFEKSFNYLKICIGSRTECNLSSINFFKFLIVSFIVLRTEWPIYYSPGRSASVARHGGLGLIR